MALAFLNEFEQNPESASRYLYFPLILPFKLRRHPCFTFHSSIRTNKWTHVVITWDREGHTASLLVNDIVETHQVSVDAIDLPLMTDQFFNIGKGDEIRNLTHFRGYIRDVKLFQKALSDNEVKVIKGLCLSSLDIFTA